MINDLLVTYTHIVDSVTRIIKKATCARRSAVLKAFLCHDRRYVRVLYFHSALCNISARLMKLHLYPKDVSLGKQIMREVNHCFFLMSLNVNFINLAAPAVNFRGHVALCVM